MLKFLYLLSLFFCSFFVFLFCFLLLFFLPFGLGHSKLPNFWRIWIINDYLLFHYHKFLLKFLYLLLFFFFFFFFFLFALGHSKLSNFWRNLISWFMCIFMSFFIKPWGFSFRIQNFFVKQNLNSQIKLWIAKINSTKIRSAKICAFNVASF